MEKTEKLLFRLNYSREVDLGQSYTIAAMSLMELWNRKQLKIEIIKMKSSFVCITCFLMLSYASIVHAQKVHPSIDALAIQDVAKAKGYRLLFEDDFNKQGKPNSTNWLLRNNAKYGGISFPGNVIQDKATDGSGAGCLLIQFTYDSSQKREMQFRGGGVVSTYNFGYGYYETRVKLYGGSSELAGFHQSFWSMGLTGTNEAEGKGVRDGLVNADAFPQENRVLEIDGFEQDSKHNVLAQNYHIYTPTHESEAPKPNHLAKDLSKWVVMGYEWLPDRVNFYCDGKYLSTQKLDGMWKVYAPQNFWLTALPVNLASWGGLKVPPTGAAMQVDYFRFYAKSLPAVNRIGNAGFEYGQAGNTYPIAWIVAI
ncbi:MAG: hypothetical protein JWQ09_3752 [Segetibacter sp.]|nr:hypothetical protein [Segetibacter sp.]